MKKIKRIADGKYLLNVVSDTWVDTIEEAKVFRQGELMVAKIKLMVKGVKPEEIEEVDVVTTTSSTTTTTTVIE